jgi:hypothetical protein
MTMGDESLFASLAMPVVLIPILEKVSLRFSISGNFLVMDY